MQRSTANTNEHDTNKHGLKDECEQEDEQQVHMRRGDVREERRKRGCRQHTCMR
jgi:hypothetical protein